MSAERSAEKDAGRVTTHAMGAACGVCDAILEDPVCRCGNRHGYVYQHPSAWAADTWPDHACLARVTSPDVTGGDDA